jgi:hypothetical protein
MIDIIGGIFPMKRNISLSLSRRALLNSIEMRAALILIAFSLMAGCGSGGSPDSDPLPGYYVQCTIGGVACDFNKGATDGEKDAHIVGTLGYFHSTSVDKTQAELDMLGPNAISLDWQGSNVSRTTGKYTISVDYFDSLGNEYYNRKSGDCSVTITKYEGVGGVVEGTFEGIVTLDSGVTTLGIANGKFRIKHIAD